MKKLNWKKEFNDYKNQEEKQKVIEEIMEIRKQRKKISKAKQKQKLKVKPKKIKTFDDYFLECIKKKQKDSKRYS